MISMWLNKAKNKEVRKDEANGPFNKAERLFSRVSQSTHAEPRPGFKEALKARLLEAREQISMSKIPFSAWLEQKRLALAGVSVTALVVIIIAVLVFQPFSPLVQTVYAQDNFTLTAEQSDSLGVEPESTFLLESKSPVKVAEIKDQISVNTDVEYKLEQVSDNKIRLAFEEALPTNNVVAVSLDSSTKLSDGTLAARPYSWAFQVKGTFRVVGSIPGDKGTDVPVDAGLEFTFSHENIDPEAFKNALTIEPAVPGHVEAFRRTLVYVPDQPLAKKTTYTATLSGDLGVKGSAETLGEDCVIQFETVGEEEYRSFSFNVSERYQTVTPTAKPVVSVYAYSGWESEVNVANTPVHVKVHRVADFDSYLSIMQKAKANEWKYYTDVDTLANTAELPVVAEFDQTIMELDWQQILFFPAELVSGYYLVDLTMSGERDWMLIQSSDLTGYVAQAEDRTLVWVNRSSTVGAVSGATVKYVGSSDNGQTGADGLAYVPTPTSDDTQPLIEIRSGSEAIAMSVYQNYWYYDRWTDETAENYWSYLYTDRPMYQPNDTIEFWGFAEDRASGNRPESVKVWIGESQYCWWVCDQTDENPIIFDVKNVETTERGTFNGTLQLPGLAPGGYTIKVEVDGVLVSERNITVEQYVKPAYTLSVTPDVTATFTDTPIGYTVHGEFFDGTPMKGLDVRVDTEVGEQMLTLDDAGNARGSITIAYADYAADDEWYWHAYPGNTWIHAVPARPEEGSITADAYVQIFGPKVYLKIPYQDVGIKDGVGTVKVGAYNVDPSPGWEGDFAASPRVGQTINGKLIEVTYVRTEIGTTYDFVRKETVMQYRYDRVEKELQTFSLAAGSDGTANFTFPAPNKDANYIVKFTATDENGRTDRLQTYVWQKYEYENYGDNRIVFHNEDEIVDEPFYGYGVGDVAHLAVYQSEKPFVVPTGTQFLYFQAHQGIQETSVSGSARYEFPFEDRDVPNLSVYGVLFTGDGYVDVGSYGWGASGYPVSFDTRTRELKIEIIPGKETYRPGEEATVAISATDAEGRAVPGVEINVNIVDEAFYALVTDDANPLGALYQWVSDGIITTQASSRSYLSEARFGGGAEKGGGGERGRYVFKDTAAFMTTVTDVNGQASASFTLPDNITSWRVTAQGIEADRKLAGYTKIDIDTTLPFFINPVMRNVYLNDDKPVILVNAAGTDIGLGDQIEYTVKVADANFEDTRTAVAGETFRFSLPELAEGSHEVTITGKTGNLTDRVTRTVTIVPSWLMKPVIDHVTLGGNATVSGSQSRMTEVWFLDGTRGKYYPDLTSLAYSWGDRADEALVRAEGAELLKSEFGEEIEVPETDWASYQESGIKLLTYASPDYELSAKVALFGDTPFDESNLANYFGEQLYNSNNSQVLTAREVAQGYAALAALGQPVLGEVQRFVAEQKDLGDAERIWLALALYFSGDKEGARTLYRDLTKSLTESSGYLYLETKDDLETTAENTALMAVLAGGLNESQVDKLYDYLFLQPKGDTLVALEQLLFIREAMPNLTSGEASVAYNYQGERKTVSLEKGKMLRVVVDPEGLNALDAKPAKGSVIAVSKYETPLVDPNEPGDPTLGLKREYVSDAGSTNTFSEGDLVHIRLTYTLPYDKCGYWENEETVPCEDFEVVDVLPSGLSPVTQVWAFGGGDANYCVDYPWNVDEQRVTFDVWGYDDYGGSCGRNVIDYYARVVTPGEYEAEPAFIRSVRDPEMSNHSEAQTITITE